MQPVRELPSKRTTAIGRQPARHARCILHFCAAAAPSAAKMRRRQRRPPHRPPGAAAPAGPAHPAARTAPIPTLQPRPTSCPPRHSRRRRRREKEREKEASKKKNRGGKTTSTVQDPSPSMAGAGGGKRAARGLWRYGGSTHWPVRARGGCAGMAALMVAASGMMDPSCKLRLLFWSRGGGEGQEKGLNGR